MILKSQGVLGFPDDLQWLYGYFAPHRVRNMPPEFFLIVTRKGALGIGEFPELPWHKKEKENVLRSVGIKVEHGDRIDYGESKGVFKTVGDEEHVKIIGLYMQDKSMGTVAKELDRSSATVHTQISRHTQAIERQGFCVRCKRMRGAHDTQKAIRAML